MVWSVDGPHMGSLLTLPRHFNGVCKVLNGQNNLEFEHCEIQCRAPEACSGPSDWRSVVTVEGELFGICQHQVEVAGWAVWTGLDTGEVITAYPITRGWKCCQPLSHCFPI